MTQEGITFYERLGFRLYGEPVWLRDGSVAVSGAKWEWGAWIASTTD